MSRLQSRTEGGSSVVAVIDIYDGPQDQSDAEILDRLLA
jgi:hypothetical protein